MADILIVDDAENWQHICRDALEDAGYRCDFVRNVSSAVEKLSETQYQLLCVNYGIPDYGKGNALIQRLNNAYPKLPVLLVTGYIGGSLQQVSEKAEKLKELQRRYTNIKKIIIKGSEDDDETVVALLESVDDLLSDHTAVTKTFSWLHLSDLHLGVETGLRDWRHLKQALLQDLKEHQSPASMQPGYCAHVAFKPDMIFITGDVAYHAAEEEYAQAKELLEDVWHITGLDKTRTMIVPGNHDVSRVAISKNRVHLSIYEQLAERNLSQEKWLEVLYGWWADDTFPQIIKQKFESYLSFAQSCSVSPPNYLYYVHPFSVPGYKIDIVGLNSAIISWQDGEDRLRNLWIGKPQLDEIESQLSEDAHFRIALVHHPREAFHEHDVAWNRMSHLCPLILHGHLHKPEAVLVSDPAHSFVYLPGGSVHQGGTWQSQRYSYGQIDLSTGQLDLYLRMTKPDAYPVYVPDILTYHEKGADGHVSLALELPNSIAD